MKSEMPREGHKRQKASLAKQQKEMWRFVPHPWILLCCF